MKRWVVSVQPPGKRRAGCRGCREPLDAGEARFTPASKVSCRSWYYHQGCVKDPAAMCAGNIDGLMDLSVDQRQVVEHLLVATPTVACLPMGSAQSSDARHDDGPDFEQNELRSLCFWDTFDWEAARRVHINTMGVIPDAMRHSVMEAKAAILGKAAETSNADVERAWKLLTVFDRLVLWRPSGSARWAERDRRDAIAQRLRLFWRGAWHELWANAVAEGAVQVRNGRKHVSLSQKAARMEQLIEADEVGKALKMVFHSGGPNTNPERVHELRALFPGGGADDAVNHGSAQWTPEFEACVHQSIAKLLTRLPRGTGVGPDSSRYEHWGGSAAADVHVLPAATCMVAWLQGSAPEWAYMSQRGGRILALDKKDGGLRPLVLCSVFRRIALRGLLAACRDDFNTMVGPAQFALGKKSGDVTMVRLLEAAAAVRNDQAVLSIDIKNAFGTMRRGWIEAALRRFAPRLVHLMHCLYSSPSTHLWAADGRTYDITATTGVDQGCPFSMLAFMVGLRAIQENVAARFATLGLNVVMASYADDTYIVAKKAELDLVESIWREEAARAGLQLADHKRAVWVPGPAEGLSDAMKASLVQALPVLGHTAERDVLASSWAGIGESSSAAWRKPCEALVQCMDSLAALTAAGLSKQSAQAMLRMWTGGIPTHVLRGVLVDPEELEAMDARIADWWGKLLELDAGELSADHCVQLHLPLSDGGLAGGGLRSRGAAAFLVGAATSYPVVARLLGVRLETLLSSVPSFRCSAEAAAMRLEQDGVSEDLVGWMRGRGVALLHAQRRWTRIVQEHLQEALLHRAPNLQVFGLRSGSGVGASAFLQPPRDVADRVADAHFIAAVRARLGLALAPPANPARPLGTAPQCQHRPRLGGPCCGAPLDGQGLHAAQCQIGGHVLAKHDDAVKLLSRRLRRDLGAIVSEEQRRPELDRVMNGVLVAARLDLVVVLDGVEYLLDVTFTDHRTEAPDRAAARLRRSGIAAEAAEDAKRRRYGDGSNLIPIAIENGGRLGQTGLQWLRAAYTRAGATQEWQSLLRALSAHTQSATAATVIAAIAGA